jgi:hypothetical protein
VVVVDEEVRTASAKLPSPSLFQPTHRLCNSFPTTGSRILASLTIQSENKGCVHQFPS